MGRHIEFKGGQEQPAPRVSQGLPRLPCSGVASQSSAAAHPVLPPIAGAAAPSEASSQSE